MTVEQLSSRNGVDTSVTILADWSGCAPYFRSGRGFVLVLGPVQAASKRCDYKLMRLALCKQTKQKVYNPSECYPSIWSSWETPHSIQQCCHCSKHFRNYPQSLFRRKSDSLLTHLIFVPKQHCPTSSLSMFTSLSLK